MKFCARTRCGCEGDARIAGFRLHDTRHVAITKMAKKAGNAVVLSAMTRHKDPKVLRGYFDDRGGALADMLE